MRFQVVLKLKLIPYFIITSFKVLFLGCGDLMSPLATVVHSNSRSQNLEMNLNNSCPATTARNIFILKTICSSNFDPNDEENLNYIWDVMNNSTWPESTYKKFTEDVKSLRDSPLPQKIIIPECFQEQLKDLCTGWLTMMDSFSVEHVLVNRYICVTLFIDHVV